MSPFSPRTVAPALLGLGLLLTIPVASALTAPAAYAAESAPIVTGGTSLTDPVDEVADGAGEALRQAADALLTAATVSGQVTASGLDVAADTTIDTSELRGLVDILGTVDVTPTLFVPEITDQTVIATAAVLDETDELRTALADARQAAAEKKAAEEAAAKAAAEAKARAAAEAEALAAANTVAGAKATAQSLASSEYGWGSDQFSCLVSLWNRESGWDYTAYNASSGATGIPQALPGSKMASAGSDWQTNATTQIRWGLDYISRAYGTPCGAWGHSQSTGWY